jgi:Ca2+-binding EF-hand superfamily protein
LWSVFQYFDTNDSGYITVDSVILALKESGVVVDEEGLRDTFRELKKNGKSLNFEEFKAIAFKSFGEIEETEDIRNNY